MNETIRKLMGTGRGQGDLKPANMPEFPLSDETWPVDDATGNKLMRFDWKHVHCPVNTANVTKIRDYMRTMLTELNVPLPTVKQVKLCSDADLEKRIWTKIKYLAKGAKAGAAERAVRSRSQTQAGTTSGTPAERDEGDTIEDMDAAITEMRKLTKQAYRSQKNSRGNHVSTRI